MIIHAIKRHPSSLIKLSRYTLLKPASSSFRRMSLSKFLVDSKQHYLRAVQEGKGREWTVVMGNEAGDLDSVASSIAYSWFAATVQKTPSVALIQTPRNDLELRPENIHAFTLASLSPSREELLCIDDLSSSTPFPSNRFALVDHNHLLPRFSDNNEDAKVVAILDHHADEDQHKDTADPRIIIPTGSASSIVARYIEQSIPRIPLEIARLLLCAILVDTTGLMPGGKAGELDEAAARYLLPQSELGTVSVSLFHDVASVVSTLTYELLVKKSDVMQLSTTGLLRRDYKQYTWETKNRIVHVGLSTVPVDLCTWLARERLEDFWWNVDAFMDERKLDILGILTTFHREKRSKKKKHGGDGGKGTEGHEGKHKRQILIIIRDVPGGNLEERLCSGIEGASELALERRSLLKLATKYREEGATLDVPMDAGIGDRRARAYKQGNAKATRKVIAPLLRSIIERDFETA